VRAIPDLRVYQSEVKARDRLDKTGHEFYLGKPYFEPAIVQKQLLLPTTTGTLEKDLRSLATTRIRNGSFCAAHDLLPLSRAILLVGWNKEKQTTFAEHYGLPRRTQTAPPPATGKKKGKAKALMQTMRGFGGLKSDKGGSSPGGRRPSFPCLKTRKFLVFLSCLTGDT
jgi:hypothetical protein